MLAYTIGDDHHVPFSNGCIGLDVQAPTYTKAAHMTRHHVPTGYMNMQCKISAESTFEISFAVGPQPKFALVDTFSHASCKNRQNVGKQSTFPTT